MYSAIVQDHLSMIRAVRLKATTDVQAATECGDLEKNADMLTVYFLINTDTGDIQRVFYGCNGYKLHRSAYDILGKYTDHEYFDMEEAE